MADPVNKARGEAALDLDGLSLVLRPSFGALVAAEEELGSLFDLVDRAANGRLLLAEMVTLFWHNVHERPADLTRAQFGELVAAAGLAAATPALKILLRQILQGKG